MKIIDKYNEFSDKYVSTDAQYVISLWVLSFICFISCCLNRGFWCTLALVITLFNAVFVTWIYKSE